MATSVQGDVWTWSMTQGKILVRFPGAAEGACGDVCGSITGGHTGPKIWATPWGHFGMLG